MLEAFSDAVGLIYDAAADPTVWPAALQRIGDLLGGFGTSLIIRDMRTFDGHAISTHAPETASDFWRWRDQNPFAARAARPRTRLVEADQHFLPRMELERTAYYNEYWRRHDMNTAIMGWLHRHGTVQQYVTTARPVAAGLFERRDVELLELLVPHLQRAVLLQQRLQHGTLTEPAATDILDAIGHAIILLDAAGMPVHVNRAGERLLSRRDGLSIERGRLCAATPSLTAGLDRLLSSAIRGAAGLRQGGSMLLPRPSGKPALVLVAVPLRNELEWLRPRHAAVCLSVVDLDQRPSLSDASLGALFGLTPAEAAVARLLLRGVEAREIAAQLSIGYATARTHLARIMEKTATHRQAELVGLLSRLAAATGGSE